jgi:hypothetical protein
MEVSSTLKFSKKLTKNETNTITYSGYLFKNNSESVTIVYGFGDNWNNTTEKEMTKTENGFVAEIEILDSNKINFCFRNSNFEWDNNYSQNYTSPISEPEIEETFILNENVINEILDNLFENNIAKIEENANSAIEEENVRLSNQEENFENIVENNEISEENGVIELVESSVVNEENIEFDIEETKSINIEETLGNVSEETALEEDLNKAFSELYKDIPETQDEKKEEIVNFDMDSLVDEILSPIVKSENVEEEIPESYIISQKATTQNIDTVATSIENQVEDTVEKIVGEVESNEEESLLGNLDTTTALTEVAESENHYLVSPRSLGKFYMFKKKIKLAVYKFFTAIPKILSSVYDEEDNK